MLETEKAKPMNEGNQLYQIRARKAFPILVRQAKAHRTITYEELAQELGMKNPRNLNYVLGSIGQSINIMNITSGERIPSINCLVVNKSSGLPGDGIMPYILKEVDYRKLSLFQKKELVKQLLYDVYYYQNWEYVLVQLGLEIYPQTDYGTYIERINSGYYSSGESDYHEKFKEYVYSHPSLLKLSLLGLEREMEKGLPSGDKADVFFSKNGIWKIAEVKSKISDIADIYRGIFQCIKYQALFEAYQISLGMKINVEVYLVLEGQIPTKLIPLVTTLGINYIDNVFSN
jgi:hypothetical protein